MPIAAHPKRPGERREVSAPPDGRAAGIANSSAASTSCGCPSSVAMPGSLAHRQSAGGPGPEHARPLKSKSAPLRSSPWRKTSLL